MQRIDRLLDGCNKRCVSLCCLGQVESCATKDSLKKLGSECIFVLSDSENVSLGLKMKSSPSSPCNVDYVKRKKK